MSRLGPWLEPCDILLVSGESALSDAIRWATRAKGEPKSIASHAALVTSVGWGGQAMIIEAVPKGVVKHSLQAGYRDEAAATKFAIYRPTNLTLGERKAIIRQAARRVGDGYPYLKLLLHLADSLLPSKDGQHRYFFRRISLLDRLVCSGVVGDAYAVAGKDFGVDPKALTPDDIDDFCLINFDKYEQVLPWGPLDWVK